MKKCKNCGSAFDGNFCSQCGQSGDTEKIGIHFIWHDIQHGLFHFDTGILYSVKELYLRPGHSIREYIEGKRIRHFKPISLLIVLATVYGLLYGDFHINLFPANANRHVAELFNSWISTHYSWLTLALVPIYTVGTFICFRDQGYNFVEYLILNSYKASQRIVFHIFTFPIVYHYNGTPTCEVVVNLLYLADIALIYWTNIQFFNRLSLAKVVFRSLLSHAIFLFLTVILLVVVLLVVGVA